MPKTKKQEETKVVRIDQALRDLAAARSGAQLETETDCLDDSRNQQRYLAGDPDCPLCHGLGYLRRDLPVTDPDFGKMFPCRCRHEQIAQRVHQNLYSLSNLAPLAHLTFANFKKHGLSGGLDANSESVALSIESAYNASVDFAQRLDGWLLLEGGYGCGKTHLAAAIANYAVSLGVPTLFLTVPDLLDMLRFAYDDKDTSFEQRFDEIRTAPLLIMDDFGTHNATAWAQEKLFQIINYRHVNRLPLVVTTNMELSTIEGRIRSRLEDRNLAARYRIDAPDYRYPVRDTGSDLSALNLYARKTFATWNPRSDEPGLSSDDLESLTKALKEAKGFARDPRGWLVITGPYGCGKTHLAAAIANQCRDLQQNAQRGVVFLNVPDFLRQMRATFDGSSNNTVDRIITEARQATVLILDDLGAQSMTNWAREMLYQILNYRYVTESATVITTADLKEEMDPRLFVRMKDPNLSKVVAITAPAFTTRKKK